MRPVLSYGTKVRIKKPGHENHGKIGYINSDNWIERIGYEDMPCAYIVDIPTPDNEDVNHWSHMPSELEIV